MTASVNERLRTALLRTGTTTEDLALCCGVDPKTAERWISTGRVPHRRHRWAAARRLGCEDEYLWSDAPGEEPARRAQASRSEHVRLHPDRGSIPRETWRQLPEGARGEIGVLVYAALFLAEDTTARTALAKQAQAGVRVRLLVGAHDSPEAARRGEEEGIGAVAIGAKIRNVLALFQPLLQAGAEIRLDGTVLYNSMYRPTTTCSSTPTCTGTLRPAPRCCTCAASPAARGSPPTSTASSASGTAPSRGPEADVDRKIDHHDDPAAPKPNSMVPAVSVVVARDDGAILLIGRTDNGTWALPGGAIEMSESVRSAAIRETLEETGINCEITGLAGIYSDPGTHYTPNDEVRREFSIVLTARPLDGQPTRSAESSEFRWVRPRDFGAYTMD